MRSPSPLRNWDKIAIISPATTVRKDYVTGARDFLESEGFKVDIYPHALGPADGNYASGQTERREDLVRALSDPEVKCILCARGGYGCCHLLDAVDMQQLSENPKWLIGFSDVSALHALLSTAGVRSLHGPMAKHLTQLPDSDPTEVILKVLRGEMEIKYNWRTYPGSIQGKGAGVITGGNLAVINGLANTRFHIISPER